MITSGFKLRSLLLSSPLLSLFSPVLLQRRRLPSPRSIRRMEGAEHIPLGFLGVIHRGSGSVTFQEHDCRLARGWLEAVTLLYERCELSHPASDTRGFSCRINGRREPRSSVDARINIAGCVRPSRATAKNRLREITIRPSSFSTEFIVHPSLEIHQSSERSLSDRRFIANDSDGRGRRGRGERC